MCNVERHPVYFQANVRFKVRSNARFFPRFGIAVPAYRILYVSIVTLESERAIFRRDREDIARRVTQVRKS